MAIKVNSNTAIDDNKDLYANTLYVAGSLTATYGYTSGGYGPVSTNVIDNFPFASPFTTATDAGNLSQARFNVGGESSSTQGFTSGGTYPTYTNIIDKFPFSSPFVTASDHGDISGNRAVFSSHQSSTEGFVSGGQPGPGAYTDTIDRFQFATPWPGTATDTGNLAEAKTDCSGHSSSTDGYVAGGLNTNPLPTQWVSQIDRFPFSTPWPGTATDIGDLSAVRESAAGQSDLTNGYGYSSGGQTSPPAVLTNIIDKFPFSSPWPGTATDAGDLNFSRDDIAGQSGDTQGWSSGGYSPPTAYTNYIESFPFSSPFTTATDAGNLSVARYGAAGQQG